LLHRVALETASQVGRDVDSKWVNLETLCCYGVHRCGLGGDRFVFHVYVQDR